VARKEIDGILHVGDFAYDLHTDHGRVGDEFLRAIESIAASLPYQTCPGNHEAMFDFLHYRKRFFMPGMIRVRASLIRQGQSESMFFSFNVANAHIVAIDTEAYFVGEGFHRIRSQFEFCALLTFPDP
jgi:acid phosphatase type 7